MSKRKRGKSAVSGFVRSTKSELGLFETGRNSNEPQLYPLRRCQNKYVLTSSEQEELVEISRHVLSRMLTSPFNLLFKSSPQDHFIFDETASLTTEFIDKLVARRPSYFPKELQSAVESATSIHKRRKIQAPLIEEHMTDEEPQESEEEFLEVPQEEEEIVARGIFEDDKEDSESSGSSEAVF